MRDIMIEKPLLFGSNGSLGWSAMLLAGFFTCSIAISPATAQTTTASPAPSRPTAAKHVASTGTPTRYLPNRISRHAAEYFGVVWGVDSIRVKAAESGELIRFSYRVLDPDKAKTLNDKKIDAYLIAPIAIVRLSVPSLEKVGQLRQSSTPAADKSYWMAFSNPGRRVRAGDRVDVVIGHFHAEGLVVE
jgi:hypothetical protein